MARDIQPTDAALDRLLKALPAEITGGYLGVRAVVDMVGSGGNGAQDATGSYVLASIILILALGSPFFLSVMGLVNSSKQRMFLSFSFAIWAANIDYVRLLAISPSGLGQIMSYFIPITLILWASIALPVYLHVMGGNK